MLRTRHTFLLAFLLVVLSPAAAQAACTNTWIAGAGDWSNGANWSPAGAPASTDDVCIPAGAGTVQHDPAASSVRSLQLARALNLVGSGTLTMTGTGATNNSQLTSPAAVTGSDGILRYAAASTLEKLGAGDVLLTSNVDFDGPLNLNAGSLSLGIGSDSADTNSGAITLADGTTFAIGVGGFGTHNFDGAVTDGANSATVTNASGNLTSFNGPYSVRTTTNTSNLNFNGATSLDILNLSGTFNTLGGSASYTISQAFNWSGGVLGGSGTTTVAPGAVLDFQGASPALTRTLHNDSTSPVALDVSGLVVNGVFDNRAGSTFRLPNDQDVGGSGQFLVRSGATLEKLGAGDSQFIPDVDFDGPVNLNAGTLSLGIGSDSVNTNSGTITLAGGTTLAIGVGGFGTHNFAGTVTDGANSATVTNASGNLTSFNGPYSVHTTTNSANLNFNGSPSLEVLNHSGTFNVLGGTASYTISQAFNWTGGELQGPGTTTLPSTATVNITGANQKVIRDQRILRNETTTLQPPADGPLILVDGTVRLDNAGTLTFPDDRDILGEGTVRNLAGGTLQKTGGAGGESQVRRIENAGTLTVAQGTLRTALDYTQTAGLTSLAAGTTFDPADTFTLSGGVLRGSGQVTANVSNSGGTVRPGSSPGTLTIVGGYTQGAGGTLETEIDGTAQGTQYDHLSVTGPASLAGTLAIVNSHDPAPSDAFEILTSTGPRTGTFSTITGADFGDGSYVANYDPNGVILTVGFDPPQNSNPPTISGSGVEGETLTCNPGSWSGSPSFSFQWLRDGSPISGATEQTYTLTADDVGKQISCRVTGSNGAGSDQESSAAVTPTAKPVPQQPQPEPRQEPQPQPTPGPACADTVKPTSTLRKSGVKRRGNKLTLSGTSHDQGGPCPSGLRRVQVSVARVAGRSGVNCRFLKSPTKFSLTKAQNCRRPVLFTATGTDSWSFTFNVKLPPGEYRIQVRGADQAGNKETPKKGRSIVILKVR